MNNSSAISSETRGKILEAAAQLGYGGVKYFDLRQNRLSDYVFSFDRMLSPEGDTNVYLQYSHARCMSIIRKAPEEVEERNQDVSNRFRASAWVLDQDYWRYLFGDNLPPDGEN